MTNLQPSGLLGALRSPGFKFFVVGLIGFLLLIPALMVWMLVSERQSRAVEAANEVARSWGGRQALGGVMIAVPYETQQTVQSTNGVGLALQPVRKMAIFLAESLSYEIDLTSDERKRGIFTVPVYEARVTVSGRFEKPDPERLGLAASTQLLWQEAVLSIPVSHPRALRAGVVADIDGAERAVEPGSGLGADFSQRGVHVNNLFANGPREFEFHLVMGVKGSAAMAVTPGARDTRVKILSNWPHPSFFGGHLPDTSSITKDGFSASWRVPHLALSMPLAFRAGENSNFGLRSDQALGVRLYQPVDHYQLVERAIKYAVLFIGSVFVAVFVLETRSGKAVHGAQYALMGLALVLFYVLLLAFAEHIGFKAAYGVAAGATTALVSSYCGKLLGSRRRGIVIAGLLGAVFGLLFLFLQMEDFALLAGAIFAFAVLATVMFSTASLDWSGCSEIAQGSSSPTPQPQS